MGYACSSEPVFERREDFRGHKCPLFLALTRHRDFGPAQRAARGAQTLRVHRAFRCPPSQGSQGRPPDSREVRSAPAARPRALDPRREVVRGLGFCTFLDCVAAGRGGSPRTNMDNLQAEAPSTSMQTRIYDAPGPVLAGPTRKMQNPKPFEKASPPPWQSLLAGLPACLGPAGLASRP